MQAHSQTLFSDGKVPATLKDVQVNCKASVFVFNSSAMECWLSEKWDIVLAGDFPCPGDNALGEAFRTCAGRSFDQILSDG